jgi:hypothetical protein
MKLTIENLGSIKQADLDIKPLTVLVGPNNTNKTWAAYSLYALASLFAPPRQPVFFNRPRTVDYVTNAPLPSQIQKNIVTAAEKAANFVLQNLPLQAAIPTATPSPGSQQASGPITQTIKRSEVIADITFPIQVSLDGTAIATMLAIVPDYLPNAKATLEISDTESQISPETINLNVQRLPDSSFQLITEYRYAGLPIVVPYANRVPRSENNSELLSSIATSVRKLALSLLGNVLAFPAERVALVSLYSALQIAAGPTPTGPVLSWPVADFTNWLQTASFYPPGAMTVQPLPLKDIAELLQDNLLKGKTQFVGQALPKPLEYAMLGNNVPLRIHAASSLVKSLAALSIYVQNAGSNDLLIIDEPEMNAHPEAQLAITELLAILVNKGVRIVITTHSPYIVDHLKNLVEAADVPSDKQDELAQKFILKTKESFLKPDKLAVYLFQDGEAKSIYDKEKRSIDWSTFADQSDIVGNLYSDILAAR